MKQIKRRNIGNAASQSGDGVIVVTYNRGLIDKKQQFPAVAIDHYLAENIHVVSSDNFQGGEMASRELIKAGCKKNYSY